MSPTKQAQSQGNILYNLFQLSPIEIKANSLGSRNWLQIIHTLISKLMQKKKKKC